VAASLLVSLAAQSWKWMTPEAAAGVSVFGRSATGKNSSFQQKICFPY